MPKRGRPRKIHTEAADIGRVTPRAIPAELTHFDQLPDSAHVRLPVVTGLLGCSASAVWRNVKAGNLPSPVKLTPNITGWRVSDLRAALSKAV
jgi:predicted DNA-binding transcriptional regulator AlpA